MAFKPINALALSKFNSARSMNLLTAIEESIDKSIIEKNIEAANRTFAPSSFRCARLNWFRIRGIEKDKIATADRVLEFSSVIGTACHEMIQGYLCTTDYWVEVEDYLKQNPLHNLEYTCEHNGYETFFTVTHPYPVRFACDGVLSIDGEFCLLEIKSCTSDSFRDLTDPKSKHMDQVKCYCTLLELSRVIFIYIDRTYGDMKCYDVRITQIDKNEVTDKFNHVMWCVEYDIAPEPLPSGDSWCTSNMCPYYKKCKSW